MNDRILRSNADKTNLVSPVETTKRTQQRMSQPSTPSEPTQQLSNMKAETDASSSVILSTSTTNTDLQTIVKMLQTMEANANRGRQELKELNENVNSRFAQVGTKVEQLTSRIEQSEINQSQQMKSMQEQIDEVKLANTVVTSITNQSSSTATGGTTTQGSIFSTDTHSQGYSLLRIALDKQIDELKPYYGKKQENIESWIKKIDKLAEIAKLPDEEIFTLARIKLQGDAEKWWDNKKKEIDSWTMLRGKLIDTFGSLGKSNKLELEAILHQRQQQLNEPATKYWNDMMGHCSNYDENMSTQDRIWRIVKGALPEFRNKYENKTFDDVDQLLKALIQHEENRLRFSNEEQERHTQISNLGCPIRLGQSTLAPVHQQFYDTTSQSGNYQQRPAFNTRQPGQQQTNGWPQNNNGRWSSNYPN
jgi:hypothetical protein